ESPQRSPGGGRRDGVARQVLAAAGQADQDRRDRALGRTYVQSRRRSRRVTKSGQPARAAGGYTLNPKGQPHSALIGTETVSLVIYRGEPDDIVSMEVVDLEPAPEDER